MGKMKPSTKALLGTLGLVATARAVDVALVGSSIGIAVGSVAFAGYMVARGDRMPKINGMEYLAIFARPNGVHTAETAPDAIDMAPVGALAPKLPIETNGYSLVAAQTDLAWLREGDRIFAVKVGQSVPRLGVIAAILWREGRWALLDSSGAPLIQGTRIELSTAPGPFGRPMIFGGAETK